jgi:catechol-2,3-dioxygenase
MKFKDYVGIVTKLLQENPEWANYDAVYATDEEGNSFEIIWNTPTEGHYREGEMDFSGDDKPNAVCIN